MNWVKIRMAFLLICFNNAWSAKIGLLSQRAYEQQIVEAALNSKTSFLQNVNLSIEVIGSNNIMAYLHLNGKKISENDIRALVKPLSNSKNSDVLIQALSLPVFSVSSMDKSKVAVMSFSATFKSKLMMNFVFQNKWKEVLVLYDEHHKRDLNSIVWMFNNSVQLYIIPILFNSNKTLGRLSKTALKDVLNLTKVLEVTVMMLTESNIKRIFALLETELAEVKGFLFNYLLYQTVVQKSFVAPDDFIVNGFQLRLSRVRYTTLSDVLLYDAVLAAASMTALQGNGGCFKMAGINSNFTYKSKPKQCNGIATELQFSKINVEGMSGKIEFDDTGHRQGVRLNIVNLQRNEFKKIGEAKPDGTISLETKIQRNVEQSIFTIDLGRPLVVSTLRSSPFVMRYNKNGTDIHFGFLIDLLDEFSKILKFKYRLHIVKDLEYGREINGSWTGMIGDVLYQRADIALAALTVTSLRERVVDFIPYMELEIVYTRKRDVLGRRSLVDFLEPFSSGVWMISLGLIFTTGVFIYIFENMTAQERQRSPDDILSNDSDLAISKYIWFVTSSTLQQPCHTLPRTLAGRTVTGFFWFLIMILIAAYTANLAAFFTSKRVQTNVTELEEFLKRDYQFSVVKTSALDQIFRSSDNYVYQMIHQKIIADNSYVRSSKDGINHTVNRERFVYIGEEPFVRKRMHPPCNAYLVKGIMPPKSFGLPLRKNSLLRQPLAIAIAKLTETGFIHRKYYYWFNEYQRKKYCDNVYENISDEGLRTGQIGLLHFLGISFALGAGVVIALLSLPLEHIWKRKIKAKVERVRSVVFRTGRQAVVIQRFREGVEKRKPKAENGDDYTIGKGKPWGAIHVRKLEMEKGGVGNNEEKEIDVDLAIMN